MTPTCSGWPRPANSGVRLFPLRWTPNPTLQLIQPACVVHSEERSYRAAWAAPSLGRSARGNRLVSDATGNLVQLVLAEFPTAKQIPVAVRATPAEVDRATASMPQPRTIPLEMRWVGTGHDLSIVGAGITQRMIDGNEVRDHLIPWLESDVTPTWVSQAWNPVPVVRATASFESLEAVIVGMASLMALGIRSNGQSAWYSVVPSPHAPAATMLARSAGIRDADEVSTFTNPANIVRSSVLNAADVTLTVDPVIDVASRSLESIGDNTIQALIAWQPDARVVAPHLQALPNELRLNLVRRIEPAPEHTHIEIGAMVEEVVKVDGGQAWPHGVLLSPGQTDARRIESK